jgi:aspartyl-tRNA(Asn)/glutamyl-tRNA(Gln) amidotransferase subunit A
MRDLHRLGLAAIGAAYRGGGLTPTALLEALLARTAALQPRLHCYVRLDVEGARGAATLATAELAVGRDRGPLHGIPVGIKDVIDVAGLPTTCHSRLMPDVAAERDASVVALLRAGGAVIVGKLATHEFAIGGPAFDLPYPPARNPWNLDHHPGGSSSGAGAAVAAGLLPLAIGTDTAGSARNPASACGIVGIKPTYDLLPREGVFPLAWSLDHVGVLGRTVDDIDLALQALGAISLEPVDSPVSSRLRIGYVRHFHERDMPATAEVGAALDAVAAALVADGAEVRDLGLPPLEQFALVNRTILEAEGFAIHAPNLRRRPEQFSALTRAALLPGAFLTAEDLISAQRLRRCLIERVEAAFDEVDILLTASSMEPACRIEDPAEIARTYMLQARTPFNVTGHPALAMMSGLSADGLPLSVQFAGRYYEEATLLRAAAAWEQKMGVASPPLI